VVVAPVRRARFEGEYQSMRSAACASAPSHPLHVMPPRRTRNSHRPRASDRTMVDLEHPFGLPLSRTRWHRHHPRRKLMSMGNRPSFSREAKLQWAGSRERNLASGRGRTFFLTSLFIELIDFGNPEIIQKRAWGRSMAISSKRTSGPEWLPNSPSTSQNASLPSSLRLKGGACTVYLLQPRLVDAPCKRQA